jgi:cold shock CspA family protein
MTEAMENLYRSRPFKTRNADEFELSNILNLYVNPLSGLTTPFDYENSIVKGRMGSGKTMYLRANYAFYLYGMVPSLVDGSEDVVLPVFVRLSDFQHLQDPSEIYKAIILKIVEEMTSIYLQLEDKKELAVLHSGFRILNNDLYSNHKLYGALRNLAKLGSEEYIEKVTTDLGLKAGIKSTFFEASAEWRKNQLTEIKKKPNPGIKDVEDCYKNLLQGQSGKILLLIDEAGSLDKRFFQSEDGSAFFEVLMNQFRTAEFIRTKIAVYPHSYSDILTETRYGDAVRLEEGYETTREYLRFRKKVSLLISNYLNPYSYEEINFNAKDVFEISETEYGDCLEQLIYSSQGNMRRLMQLLDSSMNVAYRESSGDLVVTKEHVLEALKEHADGVEALFNAQERDFLDMLVSICKARRAYKFTFPNMSPILYKYTGRSKEYNIINIAELGSGRRGTIYAFDYAYSILKDLPTHYVNGSEKINKDRTLKDGVWISRVAQVSSELIEEAALPGKIEGQVNFLLGERDMGFLECDNGVKYFFEMSSLVESDRKKNLRRGTRVKFYPVKGSGEHPVGTQIEILT